MSNLYPTYKRGDQIAYVPSHADGDLSHPDVEFGFVTSEHPNGEDCWCRYFREVKDLEPQLRTVANSERTPKRLMRKHYFASPAYIKQVIEGIEKDV